MNRRSFLAAILATATAPAIVRAGSIMRVNPRIVAPVGGVVITQTFNVAGGADIASIKAAAWIAITEQLLRSCDPGPVPLPCGGNFPLNGRMSNEVWS